MSRDEWDVFGSDSEDEEDDNESLSMQKEFQEDNDITSLSGNLHPNFVSSLEKIVDLSVLEITQQFIKSSRTVPLNQRFYGVVQDLTPASMATNFCTDDAIHFGITQMWSHLFSNRVSQRGVEILNVEQSDNASEENQDNKISYSCDGVALFRSFRSTFENDETDDVTVSSDILSTVAPHRSTTYSEQLLKNESELRKLLVPGGFITVFMSICSTKHGIQWSASQLLLQWKYSSGISIFSEAVWDLEHAAIISSSPSLCSTHGNDNTNSFKLYSIFLPKRRCTINTSSCRWKGRGKNRYVPESFQQSITSLGGKSTSFAAKGQETWIQYERRILEDASISRTIAERQRHGSHCHLQRPVPVITQNNIDKAVQSLQTHGFVVIPGLFDEKCVQKWSDAVLSDFKSACYELLRKHNVDVINPGGEGQSDPLSYQEMAMREDLRVDLRDGPNMRALRNCENKNEGKLLNSMGYMSLGDGRETSPTVIGTMDGEDSQQINSQQDQKRLRQSLRFHPSILKIVEALCNPRDSSNDNESTNPPLYKGNFGRWNFQGLGPNGKPQPLRIGQVGAVVSLPGAADQAIHADSAHLFEMHDCLPCHYVNVFTMGCASGHDCKANVDLDGNNTGENLVGGTAFVHGSHCLSVTARLTAENDTNINDVSASAAKKDAQDEMHMRVIRPSLQPGDVLMFDCRTLHFGLANDSDSGLRRPMLYVNMTHSWFNDPKNWDNRKSIFD